MIKSLKGASHLLIYEIFVWRFQVQYILRYECFYRYYSALSTLRIESNFARKTPSSVGFFFNACGFCQKEKKNDGLRTIHFDRPCVKGQDLGPSNNGKSFFYICGLEMSLSSLMDFLIHLTSLCSLPI